jgi:hypothetical protein
LKGKWYFILRAYRSSILTDRSTTATEKFDHFTRGDFITHTAIIRSQARRSNTTQGSVKDDGHEPVAWFQVKRDNQQCVDLGER